jgi:hypothetical protein
MARLSSPTLTSLTTKQLLELADHENYRILRNAIVQSVTPADVDLLLENVSLDKPFVAYVALTGLAHLAPDPIFDRIRAFWSANPEMPDILRRPTKQVMISLSPALTLPLACEWLFHDHWHERILSEDLFKAHAGVEDIPLLQAALRQALRKDDEFCYRLCDLVDAFSHLPSTGPVPELIEVFLQFRYSYGRSRAAKAIQVTAPSLFQDKFALECLWDCEDSTRALGAQFVPLEHKAAVTRLHLLASDLWEDTEVRAEAMKRITSH